MNRFEISILLASDANIGVELGVAEGNYSKALQDSGKFSRLFGVDIYGGPDGFDQYMRALDLLVMNSQDYTLIRSYFHEALSLFEDNSLDFVYIDGFAHSGQEGGKTICDWYRKVKPGGIIAGDDYHPRWPLVLRAVDDFAGKVSAVVNVVPPSSEHRDEYSKFPSWYLFKPNLSDNPSPSPELVALSSDICTKIELRRNHPFRLFVRRLTPKSLRPLLGSVASFFHFQ